MLSFGPAGCTLGWRFCQNWDTSKARAIDRLGDWASPDEVADAAARIGCQSIAFTYKDPGIFAQDAIYCAQAAHERGVKTVAGTAGCIKTGTRNGNFAKKETAEHGFQRVSAGG